MEAGIAFACSRLTAPQVTEEVISTSFKTKYANLRVLGTEIFYVLCIAYGFVLTGKNMDLHHSLLELIPGFSWGNPVNIVWGGLYLGIVAWVGGWFVAWMHNVSMLVDTE